MSASKTWSRTSSSRPNWRWRWPSRRRTAPDLPLLRSPRIDRRGTAQTKNVLEHTCAREQLRLAAGRCHDLQADRQARGSKAARHRQGRAAHQRDRIDDAEPLDVIVERLAGAFGDIAVLDRKRRDDGRRREQQIVALE